MSGQPESGLGGIDTLPGIDAYVAGALLRPATELDDSLAPRLADLDERAADLAARQAGIDTERQTLDVTKQSIARQLAAARAEAYKRILNASGTFSAAELCGHAARAVVAGRTLGGDELADLDQRALNLGQLKAGDPVLTVSGGLINGFTAQSPVRLARHGQNGLAVQFEAAQNGSPARTVTSPIEQLFDGYGAEETSSTPASRMYIGADAIKPAVTEALQRSGQVPAASVVLAVNRAGLSLGELEIDQAAIDAARREILGIITEPRAYKHEVTGPKQARREGHTDVVDAEAWRAILLLELPPDADAETTRLHQVAIGKDVAVEFIKCSREHGQPNKDRIKAVASRLAQIDPALAELVTRELI